MENKERLPCPFCGCAVSDIITNNTCYVVTCRFCKAKSQWETSELNVIKAWNHRTPIKTEPTKKCNHEYQVKKYITHDIDDPKCEVEYSLFCSLCNKYLGTFSYGAWDYSLGQLSNDHIIEFLEGEHRK